MKESISMTTDKRLWKLESCVTNESELVDTPEQSRFISKALPEDKTKLKRIYKAPGEPKKKSWTDVFKKKKIPKEWNGKTFHA